MARSFFSSVQPVALIALLHIIGYCSALTLPLSISSSITTTNSSALSGVYRPEYFEIPEAPGFKVHFDGYGRYLQPNDCVDALIVAQYWLLGEAYDKPDYPMGLEDSRRFIIGSVAFTLKVTNTLTYEAAALFVAGMMEWGNQYGFYEVQEIVFLSLSSPPLAVAVFEALGTDMALPPTNPSTEQSNLSVLINATDPVRNDPFLYPIVSWPGFYIRFMTYNRPLPRDDSLRALESAEATLLAAHQQKIPFFLDKPRTWSYGQTSFTLTATPELGLIDATIFVVGTMNLGCEKAFVEANAIFLKTPNNLKGEMKAVGTGRLTRHKKNVS